MADPTTTGSAEQPEEFPFETIIADYLDQLVPKFATTTQKYKKFMIQRPDGKFVHFGDIRFIDYTKHLNEQKRINYLNRAVNIRGFWQDDKYSPNNLAINLLWQ